MERTFSSRAQRRLNRYAAQLLFGGVLLCLVGVLFLSLCNGPSSHSRSLQKHHDEAHGHIERDIQFLFILILTGPDNKDRRDTIRKTWLSSSPPNTKGMFVIGTKDLVPEKYAELNHEHVEYGDMILLKDRHDSYEELTTKLMAAFTWIDTHVDYKFALKVDDDSFVQLQVIHDELKSKHRQNEALYWGFFVGNAHVKTSGQWAEPNWNLCDRYLPYARGGGYVLSAGLVHYIVANQRYLKRYKSEDVSVGAWLGPLEITKLHEPRFDTEYKSRGCNNKYLITHKQTIKDMEEKYHNLLSTSKLCAQETQSFLSYQYNWTVLPSKCCHRQDKTIP